MNDRIQMMIGQKGPGAAQPRPYQQAIIDECLEALKEGHRPILTLPTGAGKTFTAAMLTRQGGYRRVLFVTSRATLVEQSAREFTRAGIQAHFNSWKPGDMGVRRGVTFAHYSTVINRVFYSAHGHARGFGKPDLIIMDECHHAAVKDGSWEQGTNARIITAAMQAGIPVLGMTATPCRAEGNYGFEPLFTTIIAGPNYRELAEQGYLKPMRVILGGGISTAGAGSRDGDWNLSDVEAANDDDSLIYDPLGEYVDHAPPGSGEQGVVFCLSRQHAMDFANAAAAEGYKVGVPLASYVGIPKPAEGVIADNTGATSAFRAGTVEMLVNVNVATEGFDAPAAGLALVLRPTQSKALHVQMAGRVSRSRKGGLDDGREATIIDYALNTELHGAPDAISPGDWPLCSRKALEEREAGTAERDFLHTLTGTVQEVTAAVDEAEAELEGGGRAVAADLGERIRRLKVELGKYRYQAQQCMKLHSDYADRIRPQPPVLRLSDQAMVTAGEEFTPPEGFRIAQSGRTVTIACGHSSGGVWVHIPGQGRNGRDTGAHRGGSGMEWLRGKTFEERIASARAKAAECIEAHEAAAAGGPPPHDPGNRMPLPRPDLARGQHPAGRYGS